CSISQASASMMADLIMGRPVSESIEVYDAFHHMISSRGQEEGDEELLDDAVALAGVSRYPARVKCALLGWMAYKDALGQQTDPSGDDPMSGAASPTAAGTAYNGEFRPDPNRPEQSEDDLALVADLEEAMRDVVDPELGINVVDLGLVYDIWVRPGETTGSTI